MSLMCVQTYLAVATKLFSQCQSVQGWIDISLEVCRFKSPLKVWQRFQRHAQNQIHLVLASLIKAISDLLGVAETKQREELEEYKKRWLGKTNNTHPCEATALSMLF